MYYLYQGNDSLFTIFYKKPEGLSPLYEVESLPEGEGILKRNDSGEFYYEPFPEPEQEELKPEEPEELTVEQRLNRIEQTTAYTQLQVEYLTVLAES